MRFLILLVIPEVFFRMTFFLIFLPGFLTPVFPELLFPELFFGEASGLSGKRSQKSEIKYRPSGITGRPVLCYFAVLPDSVDHLLYAGLRLFVLIKEQGMLLDDGTAGLEPKEIQPGVVIRHTPGGDRVDDI